MTLLIVLVVIALALLPALAWAAFFLREDVHREPPRLLIYVFAAGALIAAVVLVLQVALEEAISGGVVLLVGLALIEEVFKFIAAYLAVRNEPALDEPIDAMVYLVVAALGFATIENIFTAGNLLNSLSVVSVGTVIQTLSLRFVGATFLHALTSALVGFYWARSRWFGKSFSESLFVGLTIATGVHALFNVLVLQFQSEALIYPSALLLVIAIVVLDDFDRLKTPEDLSLEKGDRGDGVV